MYKYLYGIVFVTHIFAHVQESTEIIKSFLKNYSRPVTLLELGSEMRYVPLLAPLTDGVCVMYSTQTSRGSAMAQQLIDMRLSNVVLLNSAQFGVHELETIGRCEHFDVSIVDEDVFTGIEFSAAVRHLLHLGDYLFCIVNESSVETVKNIAQELSIAVDIIDMPHSIKKVCRCDSLKKGLDIARWNMYGMQSVDYKRYAICSSFTSKTLRKSSTHTPWIPGINMVTFIGCRGLLPTDVDIISMIGALKKIEHNDLVLGNMIVQGNKLAVIDFEDARRYVRQRRCIKVAQSFFKSGVRFKKTPENALRDYKIELRN